MVDINTTLSTGLQQFEPLILTIQSLVGAVKVLVGGVFGIYLILLIMKWRETKILIKNVASIKSELSAIRHSLERLESVHPQKGKQKKQ